MLNEESMKIKHDGGLTIAINTGKNSKTKLWKNKDIKWSDLLKRLKVARHTLETIEQYKNMSREDKDKAKDKGGFVGGKLKEDGRRTKTNIESRDLITLDIDYGSPGTWANIEFLFDFACCIYSTHSHRSDNPRYRLIIPLNREVSPDEYQAIARMIASDINIEIFDDTTYDPSRLMYWQSTPSDGEYIFHYQDGNWVDADEILSKYTFGWQDVNYWPKSSRALKNINKLIKNKQQDPTTKTGYIGAFCRTYTIYEAIETFLTDEYEHGKEENRYTYTKGHSFNGLVILNNMFAYSHQDTDPISGKGACNSFDLVRIHKFGYLDSKVDLETLESKDLKSFKKMCEFVANDEESKGELLKEEFKDEDDEDYTEETEEKIEKAKKYLFVTERGMKVNTGLLAKHIRENSNYMVVRKQGYDNDLLYWYENGVYKRISANELKGRIKNYIPEKIRVPNQWENVYKELITDVKCVAFEELDTSIDYINLKNGLYNIKTKKLEDHDPIIKSTIQLNCNYNPEAPEPKEWIKFINTLSNNDKEIEAILQEWFGVTISNIDISNLKKCLILYGTVGDTGKTQYNKMLIYMLGPEFICSTPIQKLTERFATSDLYGKRALIVDDQSSINLEDSSVFKALTGGGYITIEFKGKPMFSYHAIIGILLCCNDLPYIKDDKGEHVYNRMMIIPCNNVIPKEKQIKNIAQKLFIPEADGIFLWALKGLDRLIKNNYTFSPSRAVEKAKEEYKQMNDTVYKFLSEKYNITKNYKDKIKKTDLEADYAAWVNTENAFIGVDKKNIKNRMAKHEIPLIDYGHVLYYQGIKRKN